ncbi:SPOR domain-containing protein [Comamonas resistens]|uniref:SPOR domain-containing protein n=1 Tax=Comamonas resistens TaxID=3046670 RepID=A0ABY8SQJ2_9BURK|nr:SPOR domain-containing protein [Comamonas resistens]MDL5035937.1 SPOR domain-containing protein [Comamonas resistens]WHS65339.1 SPOR domain-containing protein [Comamonas resistens]
MKKQQRGGTILGLIFGMVIGLAAALAVAIYVTKVPVPFLNKGGSNTQRDAAEAERNKNWDPNAPLQSRQPAPPPVAPVVPPSDVTVTPPTTPAQPTSTGGVTTPVAPPAVAPTKPATGDPLGDLVKERSAAADKAEKARAEREKAAAQAAHPAQSADSAFNYFVQAGAFRGQSEAEAQRAKLAMLGWESRISEREQNGITIFRVRVGPFGKRDDAEALKGKLDGAGVDSSLVRAAK